jgi:3-oxoacyl-[acyl-carrier protein] reductase
MLAELREQVRVTALAMSKAGLVVGTDGNVSAKDPETGLVAITPSGMPYDQIVTDDIVIVDVDRNVIWGQRKPSWETPMHTYVHKHRADVFAVMHTHSWYATLFAMANRDLPPVTMNLAAQFGRTVRCAPYTRTGSDEMGPVNQEYLGPDGKGVLLGNHGTLCVGPTLKKVLKGLRARRRDRAFSPLGAVPMSGILSGQAALVTGASRGIGQAIALALAEAGARVVVSARDTAALDRCVGAIAATGGQALAVPADVTRRDEVEGLVARTVDAFGRLDILVNNAGSIVLKSFADTTVEQFRQQMEVHYMAAVVACKAAVPVMQRQRGGRIINMSSISGTIGYEHHSAYSPAKGAVIRLTEAIAKELKPDTITVNCIAPNAVDTALFDEWMADTGTRIDRTGWIQPAEIGALAVFLCSPAARSISGETIVLQGVYAS